MSCSEACREQAGEGLSPGHGHCIPGALCPPSPLGRFSAISQAPKPPWPPANPVAGVLPPLGFPTLDPVGPWPEQACLRPSVANVSPTESPRRGDPLHLPAGGAAPGHQNPGHQLAGGFKLPGKAGQGAGRAQKSGPCQGRWAGVAGPSSPSHGVSTRGAPLSPCAFLCTGTHRLTTPSPSRAHPWMHTSHSL